MSLEYDWRHGKPTLLGLPVYLDGVRVEILRLYERWPIVAYGRPLGWWFRGLRAIEMELTRWNR